MKGLRKRPRKSPTVRALNPNRVEGLAVITPLFERYVISITIAILVGLFLIQRQGTARWGGLFGPAILVWLGFLAVSGSLPRGVSPNLYGQLILAAKKKGAFIVLDADGSALHEALDFQPNCIKPNNYELSRLAERELETESEILGFCEQIHRRGIAYIIVSRGKAGLLLSSAEHKIKAVAPPVEVDSTVGAGDSVVGGFVLAHSLGKDLADCLRLACAAGTATAQTPGTELCHRTDVEAILSKVELSNL
jgi:6-phosphofructokinase 2